MSPVHEHEYETELLTILGKEFLPELHLDDPDVRSDALALLRQAYEASTPKTRSRLRKAADLRDATPPATGKVVPPWLVELLGRVTGLAGLYRWALAHEPDVIGSGAQLAAWLSQPPLDPTAEELAAGRRAGLEIADDQDNQIIDARLGHNLRRTTMPFNYDFDPRAVPSGFNSAALLQLVKDELGATVPDLKESMTNFVLGGLSLDGLLSQSPGMQREHIRKLRFESENKTVGIDGAQLLNRDAYEAIAGEIKKLRTRQPGSTDTGAEAYYEELTHVARRLVANATQVPVKANGLRERVAVALNEYVPGQSGGTLNLPALDAPETVGTDLVADNIRAVSLVYAAWNLEELKLFQVLDRVVEVFMNGQLPVGFDNGGRALSDYYFSDDESKITEAARRMTYSRVLGVAGGEVSKEAPPNRAFQDLFLRFLSSVSEFDRQRRIADVVTQGFSRYDSLSLTAEQVRKSGRDLAANMTLYGYGGTFFVAQRLKTQIERALRILGTPEILAAYGVQSPFQVIERVAASDLGGTVPNIVRCKTMAESGKEILDIVAKSIPAWLGLSGQPLFDDRTALLRANGGQPAPGLAAPVAAPVVGVSDISREDEGRLMRATEGWLAVNGIKDEQRARLGEPELTAATPSIPNATADGGAAFDQLRQLVSSGQAPSLDQLKSLLPDMGAVARV